MHGRNINVFFFVKWAELKAQHFVFCCSLKIKVNSDIIRHLHIYAYIYFVKSFTLYFVANGNTG